jgi:hypothetical protein
MEYIPPKRTGSKASCSKSFSAMVEVAAAPPLSLELIVVAVSPSKNPPPTRNKKQLVLIQ